VLTAKVPAALELALFRRFMVRVANRLAQQRWYQALVTGDNLAQVASQTLENLRALDDASELPIFRPLLTYDKQEIITLAQRIGTYELSLQPYKDCCSLVARHPDTRPKLEAVRNAESRLPMDALLERTLSELVVWEIGQESQAAVPDERGAKRQWAMTSGSLSLFRWKRFYPPSSMGETSSA
jgi:thiamine biosynthesis protein ThiI